MSETTPLINKTVSQPENAMSGSAGEPVSCHVQQIGGKRKQSKQCKNGVGNYSLKDFDFLKVLGKGTYGKVCIQ